MEWGNCCRRIKAWMPKIHCRSRRKCNKRCGNRYVEGFRRIFFDDANNELEPIGENLIKIHRIDASQLSPALKESTFTIACDVSNPFYGKEGASYVYAPQKGATAEQVEALDKGLQHYAQVLKKCTAMDVSQLPYKPEQPEEWEAVCFHSCMLVCSRV